MHMPQTAGVTVHVNCEKFFFQRVSEINPNRNNLSLEQSKCTIYFVQYINKVYRNRKWHLWYWIIYYPIYPGKSVTQHILQKC